MDSKFTPSRCFRIIFPGLVGLMLTGCAGIKPREPYYVKKPGWQETIRLSLIKVDDFTEQQRLSQKQRLKELGIKPGPWYTIGPFVSPNKSPFDVAFGPEKGVNLQKTYDNGRLRWRKRQDWKDGVIHKLSGDAGSGEGLVVADYTFRQIKAEKSAELPIYLGSNDGIQVWFNGQRVLARDIGRKAAPDQDVVKVHFKKGLNRLLIKVNNRAANHAYYFSLHSGGGLKQKRAQKLWHFVMEDFPDKQTRQQMGWEKQDNIWDIGCEPQDLKSLAERYVKATREIGKLAEKAAELSADAENPQKLQQVRELYYRSRRFDEAISSVKQVLDMVKHQHRYLRKRGRLVKNKKQWKAYNTTYLKLLKESRQYLQKAKTVDSAAINALGVIEKKAKKLYTSGLPQVGKPKKVPACRPFELNQVKLLESPFRTAMYRNRKYLYMLDSDRLLHMFRITAGIRSSAKPLGGWEKRELRGHTIGHYLSACAMTYAGTGDEHLKAKADAIVAELAKCQQALGGAYLGAFPEEGIKKVIYGTGNWWAPWYTYHKIMAGMVDMYNYCGNEQALDIAKGMAKWAKTHLDNLSEEQTQRMLDVEFGGMNEVLCNLYEITKNPDHLALARRFDHKKVFDPLANFRDRMKGLHVNTQIPKIVGAAKEYELTGEPYYYNIATYFWSEVVSARTYCTGGTSNHEHWRTAPYKLASELSPVTQESCTSYNMLKLTRELFTWEPNARYGDYYERTLYNGILPTQDPGTGMMMYFVPLASGYWKIFNTPFNSFWCCTGTGMENHAKYGESIYFWDDDGIYVNLFIPSEVRWAEGNISIRQETNFPAEEGTTLIVKGDSGGQFTIRIRIPYWASKSVIKVNGEKQNVKPTPQSFVSLTRKWKDGDRIKVNLPMKLHLSPLPDNRSLAAIMYGPLVLAGKLGRDRMDAETVYSESQGVLRNVKAGKPGVFYADRNRLKSWIKPVRGQPLTFRTTKAGRPKDVKLIPFYKLFGERYGIYWRIRQKKNSRRASGCPCKRR